MPGHSAFHIWEWKGWGVGSVGTKRITQPSSKQKHHGNKLDLVNGKLFPFGERAMSELIASVLVPRGICPDLLGE